MLKQRNLWPTQKEPSQTQEIWQTLDHEQRSQIVMTLAQLIRKIVCPEKSKHSKGANNEHQ